MTEKINNYLDKVNSELDYGLKCGCYSINKGTNSLLNFKIHFPNGTYFSNITFGIEVGDNVWDYLYDYSVGVMWIKCSGKYEDFLRSVKIKKVIENSLTKFS